MKMRLLAQRHSLLLQATALAPWIALVAPLDRAEAACDPASPVSNAIVTCAGVTNGQNGTAGYGTSADTGNTINVLSSALVAGTNNGLEFHDGTVNNSGTIAGMTGILASTAKVDNAGAISGADAGGFGILA